jgi:RNA recognition motif-containing protein
LPDSIDNSGLERLFAPYGAVRTAQIARHLQTGRSTGIGIVEMECDERGEAAISAMHYREHQGHVLSVGWKESSKNRVADPHQMFGPMNIMGDEMTGKESHRR